MTSTTVLPKPKAARQSAPELLRIICMLFIVAHHFGVHGGYGNTPISEFNSFIIGLLSAGGKLGVNVYVLISGYYLVKSNFNLRRVINTILLTVFYSVSVYLFIVLLYSPQSFSINDLVRSLFPIKNNGYWFVTCYVIMALLSPFLNKMISVLTGREHLILIALLLTVQIPIPEIGSYIFLSDTAWFITLYIISAYLRLHPVALLNDKRITIPITVLLCATVGLWGYARDMKNIICLATSLFLFSLFNSIDIGTNRVINLIAKTTFGVYLIHDNDFLRPILWRELLQCPVRATEEDFWLFSALAVLLVFTVCSLIELLRIFVTAVIRKQIVYPILKRRNAKRERKSPTD